MMESRLRLRVTALMGAQLPVTPDKRRFAFARLKIQAWRTARIARS